MKTKFQNTKSAPGLRVQSSNHQETPAAVSAPAEPKQELPRDHDQRPWRGVFFNGPQSDRNRDGDEVPAWCVYVGNEEADPVGKVYWFHNYQAADELARRMVRDRRLEFIHEASPA